MCACWLSRSRWRTSRLQFCGKFSEPETGFHLLFLGIWPRGGWAGIDPRSPPKSKCLYDGYASKCTSLTWWLSQPRGSSTGPCPYLLHWDSNGLLCPCRGIQWISEVGPSPSLRLCPSNPRLPIGAPGCQISRSLSPKRRLQRLEVDSAWDPDWTSGQ